MNQAFLDSLVGLGIAAAMQKVAAAGYEPIIMQEGSIIPSIAEPNTIRLYYKEDNINFISSVELGDPSELSEKKELEEVYTKMYSTEN